MRFFSGFSLCHEAELFKNLLAEGDFVVAGFSKGAIEACEYVAQTQSRVDLLQLISPAYFMNKSDTFKDTQVDAYRKNPQIYLKRFLKNVAYPSKLDLQPWLCDEEPDTLAWLMHYRWEETLLERIVGRGVRIEVYLGAKDKIIDPEATRAFFQPYATMYTIKEGGHILDG